MKKAQIQNMESIAVVIIVGILIILGIVFVFNQKSDAVVKDVEEQSELHGFSIALKAAGLKEIKCSSFAESGNVCLDIYKILGLEEITSSPNSDSFKYYFSVFGESEITVQLISPEFYNSSNERVENITIYSFITENNQSKKTLIYPVLVYDPVNDVNIFSIMEVKTFS